MKKFILLLSVLFLFVSAPVLASSITVDDDVGIEMATGVDQLTVVTLNSDCTFKISPSGYLVRQFDIQSDHYVAIFIENTSVDESLYRSSYIDKIYQPPAEVYKVKTSSGGLAA